MSSVATGPPAPALALRSVEFAYDGDVVLAGIDLIVPPGEVCALVGPSGAGKSTLLGLANGTLTPHGGTVALAGHELSRLRGRERRAVLADVGTVPQQVALPGNLRVVHNVNSGRLGRWSTRRSLRSLLRPVDTGPARAVLDQLGIGELVDARTDSLSGGQQQRVSIARAMVGAPRLLLADEPVSAVDPAWSDEALTLMVDRARAQGTAVVVSLHDPDLALDKSDRIVALRHGRVVVDASVASLDRRDLDAVYELTRGPIEDP